MLSVYIIPLCIVYPSLCIKLLCAKGDSQNVLQNHLSVLFFIQRHSSTINTNARVQWALEINPLTRNCLHIFVFMCIFQGSSHEMLKNSITLLRSKPLYFSRNCLFFPPSFHSFLPFFTIPFLLSLQLVNQLTNYFLANLSIFFISFLT